jgi:hypothetical protein
MRRPFVLGLGVCAAASMSAGLASANEINLKCSTAEGVQICVSAEISLRCSAPRDVPRQFRKPPALEALSALAPVDEPSIGGAPPPWIANIARDYRIDLENSAVNGEILQIDRIDDQIYPKDLELGWQKPADASVPAAHYVLDLRTGGIVVSFDNGEHDGRKFASTELRLRCTRPLRENS